MDRFEVLDAFVDGEIVDPGDVKRALSEPEGRDYLLDAWVLRGVVQEEMVNDAAAPIGVGAAPRLPRSSALDAKAGRQSWAVAAAVAGVCLIGGYLVGTRLPNLLGPSPATPPPTATVAAPPAPPTPAPTPVRTSFPVPQPTRVIQLEFQTNANVTAGG